MKMTMFMQYLFLSFFIALCGFKGVIDKGGQKEVIDLGNRREIFVDDYLIDKLNGAQIVVHTPHDEGPVMYFDKPWEGIFCGYCTIIKDDGLYRAYYRGMPSVIKDSHDLETTCVAESMDGIHWEKPKLRFYKINGTYRNNVILANEPPASTNFSPFIDKNPNAKPDQKYKALAGEEPGGLLAYVSPDGMHWKKLKDSAVLTKGIFDSQNISFWSESEKCYLCYFRTWTGGGYNGVRSVSRSTSNDFIHWSDPVAMTFGNTPPENLYTQQTSPYFRAPHIYIAIGGRLMPGRKILTEEQAKKLSVAPGYFNDCSDAYFMTTRGGSTYDRTFMEAFIRPGIGLENWVTRTNYPALNVVQTSPVEMSIYSNNNYAQPTAHLHRYSLRLDGFTSISALYKGGEIITKPFTFSGNELEINYSTSAVGEIRFEIEDKNGVPLPGYALEDCPQIIGNEISRVIQWKDNKDLQALNSKVVRLRIYLKDADLYAIRFK